MVDGAELNGCTEEHIARWMHAEELMLFSDRASSTRDNTSDTIERGPPSSVYKWFIKLRKRHNYIRWYNINIKVEKRIDW